METHLSLMKEYQRLIHHVQYRLLAPPTLNPLGWTPDFLFAIIDDKVGDPNSFIVVFRSGLGRADASNEQNPSSNTEWSSCWIRYNVLEPDRNTSKSMQEYRCVQYKLSAPLTLDPSSWTHDFLNVAIDDEVGDLDLLFRNRTMSTQSIPPMVALLWPSSKSSQVTIS